MDKVGVTLLLAAILSSIVLLVSVPAIDAWERAQGYPYGKLCEVYNNCR